MPFPSATTSAEVDVIISRRPHWMVRWGNTLFLLVLLFLLFLGWLIHYPETLEGQARIMAVNAPRLLTAPAAGRLEALLVRNEQTVYKGQPLALLQNTASYTEVEQLKGWIDSTIAGLDQYGLETIQRHPLVRCLQLGGLQPAYQSFQTTALETSQLLASGYYRQKKKALRQDLYYLLALKASAGQQKQLVQQDQKVQEEEYRAYESLARDKVIAPLELDQYKSKLLGKRQQSEQLSAQLTISQINSFAKQKEMLDLDKQMTDLQQRFYSSLLNLKTEVESWMEQFLIRAPDSGQLFFRSALQNQTLLESGQELFYIQSGATRYYAELLVAQSGLGKIRVGQEVLLRPDSYPEAEYGHLTGTVSYIYGMPNRHDSFLLRIDLPQGLRTSYGHNLFFRNNLSARAGIVMRRTRLLSHLLRPLLLK